MTDSLWKRISIWISPIGLALTISGSLEPLITLAKISKFLISKWQNLLNEVWNKILSIFEIKISILFSEFLSVFIFLSILSITSSPLFKINRHYGSLTSYRAAVLFSAFNSLFFLIYIYTVGTRFNNHSSEIQIFDKFIESDFIAFVLCVPIVFFCLYCAYQRILFSKFVSALLVLLLIFILDKFLFALEVIKNA